VGQAGSFECILLTLKGFVLCLSNRQMEMGYPLYSASWYY